MSSITCLLAAARQELTPIWSARKTEFVAFGINMSWYKICESANCQAAPGLRRAVSGRGRRLEEESPNQQE